MGIIGSNKEKPGKLNMRGMREKINWYKNMYFFKNIQPLFNIYVDNKSTHSMKEIDITSVQI